MFGGSGPAEIRTGLPRKNVSAGTGYSFERRCLQEEGPGV